MEPGRIKMLSGAEIVERGRNVTETSLPEVGSKEIIPNGTWLENQQIQTALESRKDLIAVERIDKSGSISHAIWLDEQRLAEVTQQVGGHWQYLGYKVRDKLYLLPEEALYLMETNCLLLKHNSVTVSLQKAYSLLLDDETPLNYYKVYASLSRVGYKVFRHNSTPGKDKKDKIINMEIDTKSEEISTNASDDAITSSDASKPSETSEINAMVTSTAEIQETEKLEPDREVHEALVLMEVKSISEAGSKDNQEPIVLATDNNDTEMSLQPSFSASEGVFSVDENGIVRMETEDKSNKPEMETEPSSNTNVEATGDPGNITDAAEDPKTKTNNADSETLKAYIVKRQKIRNRIVKSSDPQSIHEKFQNFPDFYKQKLVRVNVPNEEHLPRNIYLNNTSYTVNISNLSNKPTGCVTPNSRPSGNRAMYRTIKNCNESENAAVPMPEMPQFLPNTPPFQQPFGHFPNWRLTHQDIHRTFTAQPRFNQHPFFYRVMNTVPRNFVFNPRPAFFLDRRQRQKVKEDHLRAIKTLAHSLSDVSQNNYNNLKSTVNELIRKFNSLYQDRIMLTSDYNIVNTEERIETIEIPDDEVVNKKDSLSKYDQHLAGIKSLAARLLNQSSNKPSTAKHRRAFCNILKHFNKEYDAALHLAENGELIDKKLVVLDSSDSDVVATDDIKTTRTKKKRKSTDHDGVKHKKRKILANPFSVIAKVNEESAHNSVIAKRTVLDMEKFFGKNWLPSEDDFGKPLPCSITDSQHLLNDSLLLYEFMEEPDSFKSWVDLKLAFYLHMEAIFSFEQDLTESRHMAKSSNKTENLGLKPIVQCSITDDWATSLEKLRIIKTNTDVEETTIKVHFDVYNRDVANFRKTDPPKPHFRIVCIDETSDFPPTAQVRALHSKFDDNIPIVFAVVGVASISYLQINPTDLPTVCIGND